MTEGGKGGVINLEGCGVEGGEGLRWHVVETLPHVHVGCTCLGLGIRFRVRKLCQVSTWAELVATHRCIHTLTDSCTRIGGLGFRVEGLGFRNMHTHAQIHIHA